MEKIPESNIHIQNRIYSEKAIEQADSFDFGETFNDVAMDLTTWYLYTFILNKLGSSCEKSVLDIGCHSGKNIRYLAEKFPVLQTYGIDISFAALRKAQSNNTHGSIYLVSDAEALPFSQGSFEGVLCKDVIEHVNSPQSLISEVHRILTRKGLFAIKCPIKNIGGTFDGIRRWWNPDTWQTNMEKLGHSDDRLLTSSGIFRLLKSTGFRIRKVIYFDLWLQNLYDFWLIRKVPLLIKKILNIKALVSPASCEDCAVSNDNPKETPFSASLDQREILEFRRELRKRIMLKRNLSFVVIPIVRLLCIPERLISRFGIGATIFILCEKAD